MIHLVLIAHVLLEKARLLDGLYRCLISLVDLHVRLHDPFLDLDDFGPLHQVTWSYFEIDLDNRLVVQLKTLSYWLRVTLTR